MKVRVGVMVKGSPSVVVTVVDSRTSKEKRASVVYDLSGKLYSPRFRVYFVDGRVCYTKYLSWLLYKCSQCQVLITI